MPHTDTPPLRFRVATADDADVLADLHSASWRATYRGYYADAYLDGPIVAERRAFWHERYEHPREGLWTVVAEDEAGVAQGFLCALLDHDQAWGTLIDNLHVATARKGQGIGRLLMRAAADHLLFALPRRPVHLFALESNKAADGFYRHLGAEVAERVVRTGPDGTALPALRYVWPTVGAFAEAVGA